MTDDSDSNDSGVEDDQDQDNNDPLDQDSLLDYDALRATILESLPSSLAEEIEVFISQPNLVNSRPRPNWLEEEFDNLVQKEVCLSGREKEHLVRPSGDDAAPLAIRLNYPTFTV